jgi:flagellar M-ring protein FliF
MRQGASLPPSAVFGVQRLVAAAVPDLEPENVVVIDDKGQIVSRNEAAAPAASGEAEQRRAVEQYYAAKVRQALDRGFPKGGFDVAVTALEPLAPAKAVDGGAGEAGGVGEAGATPDAATVFQDWTPADRKFPLKVEIGAAGPLSSKVQEALQALAGEAIAIDPARGDVVSLVSGGLGGGAGGEAGLKPVPSQPALVAAGAGKQGASLSPLTFWMAVLAPSLAVLIGLAVMLARSGRDRSARRLSEAERQDYVRRFSQLVSVEDSDVVRQL